jgi:hypothetical protein
MLERSISKFARIHWQQRCLLANVIHPSSVGEKAVLAKPISFTGGALVALTRVDLAFPASSPSSLLPTFPFINYFHSAPYAAQFQTKLRAFLVCM